jgi:hypothetical protein
LGFQTEVPRGAFLEPSRGGGGGGRAPVMRVVVGGRIRNEEG